MDNYDEIISRALKEDMPFGDPASAIFSENDESEFSLIAKQDGILCGIDIFKRVFEIGGGTVLEDITAGTVLESKFADGDKLKKGDIVAKLKGKTRVLLSCERTALNFLGLMSGIATKTAGIVSLLQGTKIKLADTRKTAPGLRLLSKYAVKTGGGVNHRMGLSDMIMLKDNHIKAAGSITNAVSKARDGSSFSLKIEVETENFDMVREAVSAGADIIMLDNMGKAEMQEAISYIRGHAPRTLIELSGNVTEDKIADIKDLDIDIISSGAITHSAPCFDFSLK
jgi:nicotinate-nucleotide pyrophosphorylase (carboxylating)